MRKSIRTLLRAGRDSDAWPVALLLCAVLVPAVCLFWFMNAAMQNERFAARQKLADAYRSQLSASQSRLEQYWNDFANRLERIARSDSAPIAFARCVESENVDSVVIRDQRGKVVYPNTPSGFERSALEPGSQWAEAGRIEFSLKDPAAAASRYRELAIAATNVHVAARAWQASARCLAQAGQREAAVQLINETFGREQFNHAVDPQGRLIAANAELMALELTDPASPVFQTIADRLKRRLSSYETPALASPQRRFLMKELQELSGGKITFPTLDAEEVAARFCAEHSASTEGSVLRRTQVEDLWQFTTPNHRVVVLLRSEHLAAAIGAIATPENLPADAAVTLLPPGAEADAALVSVPAGNQMPGWRLALSLRGPNIFEATARERATIYLWTGVLMLAAIGGLALIAARLLHRRMALARLKNDLAATVSHELKTPLSSIRVLVDTLLDADELDSNSAREYLRLVAQENERLTRLIENFLTFSRMERNKYAFHFAPVGCREVVNAAVDAVRRRFDVPGCRFEVHLGDALPEIMADSDALVTALINLLDNAGKYSTDPKHIILRARAENGSVTFSVQDHGVGIAPREAKRIFRRFYQVDPQLSQPDRGCGLGLSIVQFVATAHGGRVSVDTQPGSGSTFAISIPVAAGATDRRKEAIA